MAYVLRQCVLFNGDLLYEDYVITMDIVVAQNGIVTVRKQLLRVFELSRSRKRSLYPNTLFKEKHMYLHIYISIQYILKTRRAHGL